MVTDINPVTPPSNPLRFADLNGTLIFAASDGVHGHELWRTDGTAAGTRLVKDIYLGLRSSVNSEPGGVHPVRMEAIVGDTMYFPATDGTTGIELWKTDGTEAGTVRVKDITPGSGSSLPAFFTPVGDDVYFVVKNQIWKSDGTEAGTVQVTNLPFGGRPTTALTALGDKLVFQGTTGTSGTELWITDGTPEGTSLVKEISPGSGSSFPAIGTSLTVPNRIADEFVVSGGKMYFAATPSGSNLRQLWVTDGTADGTRVISTTVPGSGGALVEYKGAVYLFGSTPGTNVSGSVYRVLPDGSGVSLVASVPENGSGWWMGGAGGDLLVLGRSSTGVFSLYRVDETGPAPALVPLRTFSSVPNARPSPVAPMGDAIYFSLATTSTSELWRSDGTEQGTTLVRRFSRVDQTFDVPLAVAGDRIYYVPNDGTGREPWVSDGTPDGTGLLLDINSATTGHASPTAPVDVNGHWLFAAIDGVHGRELWLTDGTAAGTRRMLDPVTGRGLPVTIESKSLVEGVPASTFGTLWNGRLYFAATAPDKGIELFSSDGTPEGTSLFADLAPGTPSSIPKEFTPFKGRLYFTTDDPQTGARTVWSTDGTAAGTTALKALEGLLRPIPTGFTAVGDTLFFSGREPGTGVELWKTDGTPQGTVLVKDINAGGFDSDPRWLTEYGGNLYFSATDPVGGRELWRSDGTEAGTVRVRDFFPGLVGTTPNDGNPTNFRVVNGRLLFETYEASQVTGVRYTLWRSDGTPEGTEPLTAPNFSPAQFTRYHLVAAGGVGYFFRQQREMAPEMWRTDGTPEGTTLVKTFNTAGFPPFATPIGVQGSVVYVRAGESQPGWAVPYGASELWQSDGTGVGTRQLFSGRIGSFPDKAVSLGGRVFFTANDGVHGVELWSATPDARPVPVVGRHVFYNDSAYDGDDPAANPADDGAIATDKAALLPGTGPGTFANVTSYSKGINGIMIDFAPGLPLTALAGLGGGVGLKMGSGGDPAAWADAPPLTQLTIRPGAGEGGADRVTLVWPDGAIKNTWLRVVVHAVPQLGFEQDDVFYFGNLIGESGNATSPLSVGALDLASVRRAINTASTITGLVDFNRDGRVNALDLAAVRGNLTQGLAGIGAAVAAPAVVANVAALPKDNPSAAGATTLLDEQRSVLA